MWARRARVPYSARGGALKPTVDGEITLVDKTEQAAAPVGTCAGSRRSPGWRRSAPWRSSSGPTRRFVASSASMLCCVLNARRGMPSSPSS